MSFIAESCFRSRFHARFNNAARERGKERAEWQREDRGEATAPDVTPSNESVDENEFEEKRVSSTVRKKFPKVCILPPIPEEGTGDS